MKFFLWAFFALVMVLSSISSAVNAQVCGNERVHYSKIDVGAYPDLEPLNLAQQPFVNGWVDLRVVGWSEGINNEHYNFSYENYYGERVTNYGEGHMHTIPVEWYDARITTSFSNVTTATNPITLSATPSGGTFSGVGVINGKFDPSSAGAGTHTIYYKAPSLYNCDWETSVTVNVTQAVIIQNFPDKPFCETDANYTMLATPVGGSYSGPGISGNTFNPGVAGGGVHSITYTVSGVSAIARYNVTAIEQTYLTLPVSTMTTADSPITLSGGIPQGGSWSGSGVSGNTFDPSNAGGTGVKTISYTIQSGTCSEVATDNISVSSAVYNIPDQEFCDGESHTMPENGGAYYYNNNPISSTFTTSTFGGPGTYTVVWKKSGFSDAAFRVDVLALPNISFSGASFCQGDGSINLSSYATPTGGSFSGSNVSGTSFNANGAPGSYSISYTYNNGSCSNTEYASFSITTKPTASLNLATNSVYQDDASFTLSGGSPSGGTYYVDGARQTTFNPSNYSVGSHIVTYTVGSGGCTDSDSETIQVRALGSISYSDRHLCVTDGAITLNDNGGTFYISGSVLSNDRFDPGSFGVGSYMVSWRRSGYTDESFTITVHGQPSVSLNSLPSRCVSSSNLNLSSYASPTGGSFSGPGVSGTTFRPATAGTGTHTIRYTYSDAYCSNSATRNITVYGPTTVSLSAPNVTYTDDSPVSLLPYASPTGGTFRVNGSTTNTLNPSALGAGTHTITYAYTNAGGCTTTESTTVTLSEKGSFSFSDLIACTDDADITLSNNGGTYTINGADIGNSFSPSTYGAGTYVVNWTRSGYTDASFTITVMQTPSITISSVPTQCYQGATIDLLSYVNPKNGSFSGPGVSGTLFTPSRAGAGTHAIRYTVTNGSCYDEKDLSINVIGVQAVSLSGDDAFCSTDLAVDLSSYPNHAGGVFSSNTGGGITGTTLFPDQIAAGSYTLTYTLNSGTGCEQSDNMTFIIMDPPTVTLADFDSVYVDEPPFPIMGGNPSGGQYYVDGNLTGTFNAANLGVGSYSVRYEVSNSECSAYEEKTIRVLALQTNNFQDRNVCLDQGQVTLNENGGTFTVDGTDLVGGEFDPMAWGEGAWEVTWSKQSYVDTKFTINVIDNEPVIVTAVDEQCIFNDPIDLFNYVTPRTGTFSGNGLIGSAFDPSIAKAGDHQILYTVNNNGCYTEKVLDITVLGVENLDFSGINGFCSSDGSLNLKAYVNEEGGTFSSSTGGVAGDFLYPELMAEGNHKIKYTINVGSGCEQSDSIEVNIMNPPSVALVNYTPVYVDAASFLLYGGTPSGGQYYVDGQLTNILNPAQLGIGVHTVRYNYSNSLCQGTAETTIEIMPLNTNSFSDRRLCTGQEAITLTENGGKFSIDGTQLVGGEFDPAYWGEGAWEVTWKKENYADSKFTITVVANPSISLAPVGEQCVFNPPIDLLNSVEPKTGGFSGNGITQSVFDPASAGVGEHTILYTVDNNGCYSEQNIPILVSGVEDLDFSGINGFCSTDGPVDLSAYVNYDGGTFSSITGGIGGTTLYPEQLSEGNHTIRYTLNLGNGCEQSDSVRIFVMNPPSVGIDLVDSTSIDAASFTLYGGSPGSGQYYVNGELTNIFDPGKLGVGVHTIRYVYANSACENWAETTIKVLPLKGSFTDRTICAHSHSIEFQDNGGVYTINGVDINRVFDPAVYGVGTYGVNWEKTGYDITTFTVTVLTAPDVSFLDAGTLCANAEKIDLNNFVFPTGGTFTGKGIEQNRYFNPSLSGSGSFDVVYSISENACVTQRQQTIHVDREVDFSFTAPSVLCRDAGMIDLDDYVSEDGVKFITTSNGVINNFLYPELMEEGRTEITAEYETENGCKYNETRSVYIVEPEEVYINGLPSIFYENDQPFFLSGGTPEGGNYYINGVARTVLDPGTLGVGVHTLTYVYSSVNGCENTAIKSITIKEAGVDYYSDKSICLGEILYLPEHGGTLSINSREIENGVFDSKAYGEGSYTVTWEMPGFADASFEITVHPSPEVMSMKIPEQCTQNEALELLNFVEPKTGSFSGPGLVNNNLFDPKVGKGNYSILYTLSNEHCYTEHILDITVNELEDIEFKGLHLVCQDAGPVDLKQFVSPAGGTFSCIAGGVIDNTLYPSLLSPGAHTIKYTVEASGCSKTEEQLMYVMEREEIAFDESAFEQLYANDPSIFLNFATPVGGDYFVNGEQTNVFNPSGLGEGTHRILYRYDDKQSGCLEEKEIVVNIAGEKLLNFRDRTFCQNDAPFQFVLDGGAIYVDNMQLIGGLFDPAIYTPGSYKASWRKEGFANTDFTISVYDVPEVIYVQVPDQCSDNGVVDLTNFVEPKTGSFSGPGLVNSIQFDPSIGKGDYSILYNIANEHCYSELVMDISVNELEDIRFEGLHLVCENATAVDLRQYVSPAGGTFSCADGGVIDNTLYPSMLEVGPHTVSYTVESAGCTKTEEQLMYVIAAEPIVVDESVFENIYANSSPMYLDFASPKGGTYYVNGMQTNIFDPQDLGQGVHGIDYYLEDKNGCYTETSVSVTVHGNKLSNYADRRICRNEAPLEFELDGGKIYVDNAQLANGIFDPSTFAVGIYEAVWKKDGFADTEFTITVSQAPEITTFSVPVLCREDAAINLFDYVEPKTGSFSGLSLGNAAYFDPSKFKGGTYTVAYTVKSETCIDIAELQIVVEGSESVVFEGLPYTICSGANPIDLMEYVNPTTGGFTNEDGAVIDDVLYPSMLSAGIHTLTYTIPNEQGCDQVAEKRIYVLEDERVSLTMESNICQEAEPFLMTGGYPIGGEYYVDGKHVIQFDPSSYAEGLHTVEYRYSNMYGCESTVSQHISILESPTVSLQEPQTLCDNGAAIMLKGGYPYGGQYAVNGKYMDSFDPKVYGQGQYLLTYEYSNGKCSIKKSQPMDVVQAAPVTIYGVEDLCNNALPVKLYGGSPSGGYYSVNGHTITVLDPSEFAPGVHTLTYNVEQNGCLSNAPTTFRIYETEDFSVNIPSVCENDEVFALSVVSPSVGNYSGPGVVNNQLDPSAIGAGNYYYEYSYKSSNGCTSVIPFTLNINAAPQIEMPDLNSVCANAESFTLTASPMGGEFSGNGVVNNVYYPAMATSGIQNITYTVKNKYGCSSTKSRSVLVQKPTELVLEDINGICQSGEPVELNFVSPGGGDYTGTAIIDNVFYPEKSTPGVKTISYAYTDRNGCVSELQSKVTVREKPDMQDFYLDAFCSNDEPMELNTEMFYTKSVYMGKGVNNNSFDPELAGPGQSIIRYLVVDEYGCSNYNEKSIKVDEAPFVFLQAKSYCQGKNAIALQGGYPTGGTYTGSFVVNNSFVPVTKGVYDIRYNYTAENGCSETMTNYVTVNEVPEVKMDAIPNLCVNSEALLLNSAAPTGGKYYLSGQENDPISEFNPSTYGVGTYTLNYSYANQAGCAGSTSRTFQVMDTEEVSILGMKSQYCKSDDAFSLSQKGYPSGGVFKLNGDMVNTFEPSYLNTGLNTLSYTYESTSGCSVTTSKSVMIAEVPPSPILDLKSIYCPGDQITIEPTNYVEEYNIVVQLPGAELTKVENGRKSFNVAELRSIDVYYQSALGCMSNARTYAVEVENRNPSFATQTQNIEKGEALQILALDNYEYITDYVWTFSDGGISYAAQPYHYFNIPGKNSFYLDYTTTAGCTFSKEWIDYIWVNNSDGLTTSIDEIASAKMKLYPNPAVGDLNIVPGQASEYTIAIFSKNGELVRLIPDQRGEKQIDVSQLSPGAYTIRLIFPDKAASKIFIKQ